MTEDYAQAFPDYDTGERATPKTRRGKRPKRTREQEAAKKKRQRARRPAAYRKKMREKMAERRAREKGLPMDE